MNKFFCALFAIFCLSLSGCGLLMLPHLIDKMAEFAERMAKIEAEKRAELRKETHSIEGEILSTEVSEKEIEVKKPVFHADSEKGQREEFEIEKVNTIHTVPYFILHVHLTFM